MNLLVRLHEIWLDIWLLFDVLQFELQAVLILKMFLEKSFKHHLKIRPNPLYLTLRNHHNFINFFRDYYFQQENFFHGTISSH